MDFLFGIFEEELPAERPCKARSATAALKAALVAAAAAGAPRMPPPVRGVKRSLDAYESEDEVEPAPKGKAARVEKYIYQRESGSFRAEVSVGGVLECDKCRKTLKEAREDRDALLVKQQVVAKERKRKATPEANMATHGDNCAKERRVAWALRALVAAKWEVLVPPVQPRNSSELRDRPDGAQRAV